MIIADSDPPSEAWKAMQRLVSFGMTSAAYCDGCAGELTQEEKTSVATEATYLADKLTDAESEVERLRSLVNTPELVDFSKAVQLEAAHQRERWGTDHDDGKAPSDWFWLLGYLAGKALFAHQSGNLEKALHHTISSAAALANWHAALLGKTNMRPGIEAPSATSEGKSR